MGMIKLFELFELLFFNENVCMKKIERELHQHRNEQSHV